AAPLIALLAAVPALLLWPIRSLVGRGVPWGAPLERGRRRRDPRLQGAPPRPRTGVRVFS
ncbi:MAG: hypothetical protein WKF33_10910, partial [Thermoleophilaceae bacterium]